MFGHELTHALFAVLFGGSVKAFHATERGGQVTVTKSNFLITLAPYFFPLYTFLVLVLYVASRAALTNRPVQNALSFPGRRELCFSLAADLHFPGHGPEGHQEQGAFFSYPLIYLFNVIFARFSSTCSSLQKNGFLDYLGNAIIHSIRLYSLLFIKLYACSCA